MGDNEAVVRRYLAAIEVFDMEVVDRLLDEAIVQTEFPNKLYPKGQVRGKAEMMRDLPRGKVVLREQHYPIEMIAAAGNTVTVETTWRGVLNVPLGRLAPGDAMVAHICMVFTVRDGRIAAQRNYDCYEGFA